MGNQPTSLRLEDRTLKTAVWTSVCCLDLSLLSGPQSAGCWCINLLQINLLQHFGFFYPSDWALPPTV